MLWYHPSCGTSNAETRSTLDSTTAHVSTITKTENQETLQISKYQVFRGFTTLHREIDAADLASSESSPVTMALPRSSSSRFQTQQRQRKQAKNRSQNGPQGGARIWACGPASTARIMRRVFRPSPGSCNILFGSTKRYHLYTNNAYKGTVRMGRLY